MRATSPAEDGLSGIRRSRQDHGIRDRQGRYTSGGKRIVPVIFVEDVRTAQCETCCGWGHIGAHCPVVIGKRCGLCAGNHATTEHQCNVIECRATRGKTCKHLVPKCANCGGDHIAFSPKCTHKKAVGRRTGGGYEGTPCRQ